ncbi:12289_t:CDS:1, partial [Funneliformis geosporum]
KRPKGIKLEWKKDDYGKRDLKDFVQNAKFIYPLKIIGMR